MAKVQRSTVERLRSFVSDIYERAELHRDEFVRDLNLDGLPVWHRWESLTESLYTLDILRRYVSLENLNGLTEEQLRDGLGSCASFCERDVLQVTRGLMSNGEANSTSGTVRYLTAMQVQARAELAARIRARLL